MAKTKTSKADKTKTPKSKVVKPKKTTKKTVSKKTEPVKEEVVAPPVVEETVVNVASTNTPKEDEVKASVSSIFESLILRSTSYNLLVWTIRTVLGFTLLFISILSFPSTTRI